MLSGYSLGSLMEANNLDLTLRLEAINARFGCKTVSEDQLEG